MKKIFILMPALIAWAASLSAQNITRKQADSIAIDYFQKEEVQLNHLFVHADMPEEESFVITTSMDETVKVKYACWAYLLRKRTYYPDGPVLVEQRRHRYLLVKKDNGHILEIITNNDSGPDLNTWKKVGITAGLDNPEVNSRLLYPNPVGDLLTFSCNGENARVEIYDLKGTRHFSGTLPQGDNCRLNVSFLSAGVYMVNISGETYKIIKN